MIVDPENKNSTPDVDAHRDAHPPVGKRMRRDRRSAVDLRDLPDFALLRLPQVLLLVPVGRSSWLAKVAAGLAPAPVRLSPRTIAWKFSSIREYVEALDA